MSLNYQLRCPINFSRESVWKFHIRSFRAVDYGCCSCLLQSTKPLIHADLYSVSALIIPVISWFCHAKSIPFAVTRIASESTG